MQNVDNYIYHHVIILKMDKNKIFRLLKLFEQDNEMRKKNINIHYDLSLINVNNQKMEKKKKSVHKKIYEYLRRQNKMIVTVTNRSNCGDIETTDIH